MIKLVDIKALLNDITKRTKLDCSLSLNKAKDDDLQIVLEYLRVDNRIETKKTVSGVFNFTVTGKQSSTSFITNILNFEMNLRDNLVIFRDGKENGNYTNGTKIITKNSRISYYLIDNEDEASREIVNNVLIYSQSYKLYACFNQNT